MFYPEPKTLIVVCKDEMLVNQLRKLVETKDDENEENIVGTRDGSVRIVSWFEKIWLDQKKAGNINDKVLLLGDIKDTDKLIPVIDVKFDDFGVKYGWAGNQAVIAIEPKVLKKKENYNAFLEKLNMLPVPEFVKNERETTPKDKAVKAGVLAGMAIGFGLIGLLGTGATMLTNNAFKDKAMVKRQMLFYGVINLYNNHLEEFMQA